MRARSICQQKIRQQASERGYIGSKQEELQSESERERASVREVGRASNDRAAQDIPGCNAALASSNNSGRLFFGPQFWTPITWPFFLRKKMTSSPPKKISLNALISNNIHTYKTNLNHQH